MPHTTHTSNASHYTGPSMYVCMHRYTVLGSGRAVGQTAANTAMYVCMYIRTYIHTSKQWEGPAELMLMSWWKQMQLACPKSSHTYLICCQSSSYWSVHMHQFYVPRPTHNHTTCTTCTQVGIHPITAKQSKCPYS